MMSHVAGIVLFSCPLRLQAGVGLDVFGTADDVWEPAAPFFGRVSLGVGKECSIG